MVLSYRSGNYATFNPRTKSWIKWLRIVQLLLRVLQFIGAAGILVLMILITKVDSVTGWIMRIAVSFAIILSIRDEFKSLKSVNSPVS